MTHDSVNSVDIFDLSERESISVKDVKLPFIVKKHTIFSPGTHNDMYYDKNTITSAYSTTNWDKRVRSIFADHDDQKATKWLGYVENIKLRDDGFVMGDLEVWDLETAIKLMGGAKFGISPRVKGAADSNNIMKEFYFENFSVVMNPAVKTTYLNSEIKVDKKEEIKMSDEEVKIPPKEEVVKEEAPAPVAEVPKEEAPKVEPVKVEPANNKEVLDKLEKIEQSIKAEIKPKEDPLAKEMAELKAKVQELEDKSKQPVRATVAAEEMSNKEVSTHDTDKGMMNLLREMEGLAPLE